MKILIRLSILSIILIFSTLISSCGKVDTIPITFDWINYEISLDYKETNPVLIENEQILNKILKAYKKSNEEWFDENIIISTSTFKKDIGIDSTLEVNIKKLKQQIIWYEEIEKDSLNFDCEWNDIQWRYINFILPKNILDNSVWKYYVSQYYFINDNKNYIISYASENQDWLETFIDTLDSLNCDPVQPQDTQ